MALHRKLSKEFISRLLSTILLVPLILFVVNQGEMYFLAMMFIVAVLMSSEWSLLIAKKKQHESFMWRVIGILYITIPCFSLFWLIIQDNGIATVTSIFVIVWATDIGGYIFGKMIGGWKLAPKISPNKTWAGFFGGILLAVIAANFVGEVAYYTAIVSVVAQLGDLLESFIKRKFKANDSGNTIPGHGGILDAVDGIVLVAPIIAIIQFLTL